MPMTFECACYIVTANVKFTALLEKAKAEGASPAIKSNLRARLDWLDQYTADAIAIVTAQSDAEFQAEAKKLKAFTDKIDKAVAEFKKINAALTAAGEIINKIVKLLAAVGL